MINWFNHMYPYGNLHELNLDWVIATVKRGEKDIADFIGINTIKYADPILWNIESQYEANTVVVDGQTGNAYISVKAVPSGVHLNRTEYWTQIYNYSNVVDTLREQIAHNEGDTTTATQPFAVDDLVFVRGLLYKVIAPMIAGDSFVENSNIVKTTIEEEMKLVSVAIQNEALARTNADIQLQTNIDNEALARGNADTQLQTNIDNEALARTNADTQLQTNIDNEALARTNADTQLQNAIDGLNFTNASNITDFDIVLAPNLTLASGEALEGCVYLDGYFYLGVMVGAEVSQKIHKVRASDGSVVSTHSYTNLKHVNSLCTDGNYIYSVTNDNYVYKIDPNTLNVVDTISVTIPIFAICKYSDGYIGVHYLDNPWRPELVFYDNSFNFVKTMTLNHPNVTDNTESTNSLVIQGIACDNTFIYIGKSDTNGVLTFSMNGDYLGSSYTSAGFTKTLETIYFENEDLDVTADGNLYIYTFNDNSRSIVIVKTNVFNYHADRGTYNIIYRNTDHRIIITNKCYTLGAILYYYHAGYNIFLNYTEIVFNIFDNTVFKGIVIYNLAGDGKPSFKLNLNNYVVFIDCMLEGLAYDSSTYFAQIYNCLIMNVGIQYISNENNAKPRVRNSTLGYYSNNMAIKIHAYSGVSIYVEGYGKNDMPPSYFIEAGGAVFQYPTEMLLYPTTA